MRVTFNQGYARLHTVLSRAPDNDLGFVIDEAGDLVGCRQRGEQMKAGCGFVRDVLGDIKADDNSTPTLGFFKLIGNEYQFRRV